ncbi:MAG: nucleotide-binding protein, PIN domain-containing protein [Verrucomicrobia bacterium]|nr:nucleotide-binding protein, PIN domain-containing protein [Verrucomicrobiota bacterium]
MSPFIVVDTNVLFAALVSTRSRLRETLFADVPSRFCCPRFLFVELFKHKDRLLAATELSEDELLDALNALLARIRFADESAIAIGTWLEAHRLCREIDQKDTPFVALTLHLDGRLWTEDEELKRDLRAKGFNSFFEP